MDSSDLDDWVLETGLSIRETRQQQLKNSKAAAPESNRYKYERLSSPNYFRLLRLFAKRPGIESLDVHCQLVTFPITSEERPTYRAISYTWGNGDANRTIYVGDQKKELPVRENLLYLLKCVRSEVSDCWIWVDAICIDQKYDEERNDQVKLMGQIYSNANIVLAFIGREDREIEYAVTFIDEAIKVGVEQFCLVAGACVGLGASVVLPTEVVTVTILD